MRTFRTLALIVVLLAACGEEKDLNGSDGRHPAPPVIGITTDDFSIAMPDTIDSGWTTFVLTNAGEQEHFAYFYRLPDGVGFQQFRDEFYTPFGAVWEQYVRGDLTREEACGRGCERLP